MYGGRTSVWTATALSDAIDEIGALADAQYKEAEAACRLTDEVYARCTAAGLFHQLLPDGGGTATDVVEWFDNGLRAASWDGSLGWIVSQGAIVTGSIHIVAPELAARIEEADGFPIASTNAGVLKAERVADDAFSLSGSVPFNSGCDGSKGLAVQFMLPDVPRGVEALRIAYAPTERWTIVRDWDVTGLRGTGSHSTAADGLVVEERDTFNLAAPVRLDTPMAVMAVGEYGSWTIAAAVAATQLGIARRALDEAYLVAASKRPPPLFDVVDDRPTVRRDLMEAEGRWQQAVSGVRAALREAWDTGVAGDRLTRTQRAMLVTSAHLANRDGAAIVDAVDRVVGTSSLRPEHPIARCSRDVRPLLGHVSCNDAALGYAAGRWRGDDTGMPIA